MSDVTLLAIESSCDETAAAIVVNGRKVLSNVISSQIDIHKLYGGVVPEIASRKHIEQINQVIEQAFVDAEKTLDDVDGICVRCPPGRRRCSKSNQLCQRKTIDRSASY